MELLSSNPYAGRVIVLGKTEDDFPVQVYSLSGRSEGTRNRVLERNEESVRTSLADIVKHGDKPTDLIIYRAMGRSEHQDKRLWVVSNGDQTDTVLEDDHAGNLGWNLSRRQYEPDWPNFTARITGAIRLTPNAPIFELNIIQKSVFYEGCDRASYIYDNMDRGFGRMISTYSGDGDPLPGFDGKPVLVPLTGGIHKISETYWNALNPDHRIAQVVRVINPKTGESTFKITNKYNKVA